MKNVIILTAFLLSACASQSKIAKVDESAWNELTCSGFKTWHECRIEAQAICPNGFYRANELENLLIQRRVVEVACKS